MAREQTNKRIVTIAGKGVKAPSKLTAAEVKAVCASCLTQYEPGGIKPVLAWAGIVEGQIDFYPRCEYGYGEIYATRAAAKTKYHRVVRVRICLATPVKAKRHG
jgi:hypothetical protein